MNSSVDLLPIKQVAEELKNFKKKLAEKIGSSRQQVVSKSEKYDEYQKALERIILELDAKVESLPPFLVTVDKITDDQMINVKRKRAERRLSMRLNEHQKKQAEFNTAYAEISEDISNKKGEAMLTQLSAHAATSQLRLEQDIDEKVGCCTRVFCCFFPHTKKRLDDVQKDTSLRLEQNQRETEELAKKKEVLRRETEVVSSSEYERVDKLYDRNLFLTHIEVRKKAKTEREFEAYQYMMTEEIMLLLIRANSCVRRIANTLEDKVNSHTPLLSERPETPKCYVNFFSKNLEERNKAFYCINPEDKNNKVGFQEFYARFRALQMGSNDKARDQYKERIVLEGKTEKTKDGVEKIFPWKKPVDVLAASMQAPLPAPTSSSKKAPSRRGSFREGSSQVPVLTPSMPAPSSAPSLKLKRGSARY